MTRKTLIGLVALAAIVAGGGAWRLRPATVSAARVVRGTAIEAVYASGTVEARERVEIKARAPGPVGALLVREGAAVRRDQVLLRIDAPTLGYDVRRGRAELSAARERQAQAPQVAALEGQARALLAQLAQARADLARVDQLVARGAMAAQELERARTQVAALSAQIEAVKAQQQDARIALRTEAARQRAGVSSLEARLSDAELRAPMDGVVLSRKVEVGEVVALNQNLLSIGDLRHLWIESRVDEADIGRVREGQTAAVRLYAFEGQALTGAVARVLPDADRERKSFEVDVDLSAPPQGLRPGMSAELNIITKRHEGALLLPAEGLRGDHVWVVNGGRLARRPVQVGIRDLARVEVLSGVQEGELVVLDEEAALRPGHAVRARLREVNNAAAGAPPGGGAGAP